jgi:uncharacterized protein
VIIRVADLEPEGLHVEAPLSIESVRTDADEVVRIDEAFLLGDLRRTRRGLEMRGRLTCRAELPCARCVASFSVAVDRVLDLRYSFAPPGGREIEIPENELGVDFLNADGELDLVAVATEQIYLELPMKPLCQPSCRGLCAVCRGDLNREECRCEVPLPQV